MPRSTSFHRLQFILVLSHTFGSQASIPKTSTSTARVYLVLTSGTNFMGGLTGFRNHHEKAMTFPSFDLFDRK
jgi:hypothetical protein